MRHPFLILSLLAFSSLPAFAQTPVMVPAPATDVPPAATLSVPETGNLTLSPMDSRALDDGAPIRLSPDGPAVINLDRDAATVIVGNPANASVVLENPRMIMLMPGAPGATKIMALDRNGKSILNRHVLVGSDKNGFMRINRVCALGTKDCKPQSTYYCPDKCYETTATGDNGNETAGGAPSAGPAPVADDNGGSTTPPDVPTETYQESTQ